VVRWWRGRTSSRCLRDLYGEDDNYRKEEERRGTGCLGDGPCWAAAAIGLLRETREIRKGLGRLAAGLD
jgi:hypothetical protein